jgi:hypothetical protein
VATGPPLRRAELCALLDRVAGGSGGAGSAGSGSSVVAAAAVVGGLADCLFRIKGLVALFCDPSLCLSRSVGSGQSGSSSGSSGDGGGGSMTAGKEYEQPGDGGHGVLGLELAQDEAVVVNWAFGRYTLTPLPAAATTAAGAAATSTATSTSTTAEFGACRRLSSALTLVGQGLTDRFVAGVLAPMLLGIDAKDAAAAAAAASAAAASAGGGDRGSGERREHEGGAAAANNNCCSCSSSSSSGGGEECTDCGDDRPGVILRCQVQRADDSADTVAWATQKQQQQQQQQQERQEEKGLEGWSWSCEAVVRRVLSQHAH